MSDTTEPDIAEVRLTRVRIVKPCRLVLDDPHSPVFEFEPDGTNCGQPGMYEVTDDIRDHWFFRAHTDNPPPAQAPHISPFLVMQAHAKRVAMAQFEANRSAQVEQAELEQHRQQNIRRTRRQLGDDTVERKLS